MPRKPMRPEEKCIGLTRSRNQCPKRNINKTKCCGPHQYWLEYSDEMKEESKHCNKCDRIRYFFEGDRHCMHCMDKKRVNKCDGITCTGRICTEKCVEETKFCDPHQYFKKYSPEDMQNLVTCKKCRVKKRPNDDHKYCEECTTEYMEHKCGGIDRNYNQCRNDAINETAFCKYHDYMTEYTEEEISDLELCSGCKMMKYLGKYRTCEICQDRGDDNRQIDRVNKIPCKYIDKDKIQCI